jgi:tetratricopeptide (TPR) repeat protein
MCAIERGVFHAMRGDVARGREAVATGRQELEELGLAYLATATAQEAAIVERLAGDPAAAEALLRPALDRFSGIGEIAFYSTDAAMLAHALYDQHRLDEARTFAELSRAASADDDVMSHYLWKSALAKVSARESDDATALRLAEEAVAITAQTDYLADHGDRLVDLAEVHILAGRRDDALAALDRADALYAQKGCDIALDTTAKRRSALK